MSNSPSTHGSPARSVGVREVAVRAGVSRQTVSRVLNDHPEVAAGTKARVLQSLDELGYRMNNAARALGTRHSRTIGILASDALEYGPSRSIAAIESSARAAGYWVSAAFAEASDAEAVVEAVDHLIAQGVEGIVAVAPHAGTLHTVDALRVGVPVLTLHSAGHGVHGFSVDHVAGARLAAAALAEAGHVNIAHLAGPSDWLEAESRAQGWAAELAARRLEPGLAVEGDWTARSGYDAAATILASGATGVFSANDQMALGLLGGLYEAGVSVPAGISVVGFDDIPDAAYYWPPLTTVRQDFDELARRAVATLTGGTEEEPAGDAPVLPTLVQRSSIAPPPQHPARRRNSS